MFGSYFQISNDYFMIVGMRLHIITVGKEYGSYPLYLGFLEEGEFEMGREKNAF